MIISFDIPNAKATRLGDAMPLVGYIFNSELGTTDSQQKLTFLKAHTIEYWRGIVKNYETTIATQAATQSVIVDFSDVV